MLVTILSVIGSVASVFGVVWVLTHENTKLLVVSLLVIITILSGVTGYLSFQNEKIYSVQAQKKREIEYKKDLKVLASNEAIAFVENYGGYLGKYNSGENKGIILAGVTFLEKHREINKESFLLVQKSVVQDINHITNKAGDLDDNDLDVLRDGARALTELVSTFIIKKI